MTSSLGILLVHLEIVATTYHSTIFKTHLNSLYSLQSILLPIDTVYLDNLQSVLESNRDASGNHDGVNCEIHSEDIMQQVCRCMWRK